MAEDETKEPEYVLVGGHFTHLDALARKLQGSILASGGTIETDEDAISHALGGYDLGAHLTDDMDNERLGQFLEEFGEAWKSAAAEVTK